jgi:hypothetical protein
MDVDAILAELNDCNPDAYLFDNLDGAIIGVGKIAYKEPVAVYSQQRIYDMLLATGFDVPEADEYFSKLAGTLAGENTPVIVYDIME